MDKLINVLYDIIIQNPASAVIAIPIAIIAFVLDRWPNFPNRLILPVCLALGMLLFPILSPWNDSLRLYPYPMLALMLLGFTLGFIAWVAHSTIIRRLIRLVGANGDSDKGNNNQQPPPKQ